MDSQVGSVQKVNIVDRAGLSLSLRVSRCDPLPVP